MKIEIEKRDKVGEKEKYRGVWLGVSRSRRDKTAHCLGFGGRRPKRAT